MSEGVWLDVEFDKEQGFEAFESPPTPKQNPLLAGPIAQSVLKDEGQTVPGHDRKVAKRTS